MCSVDYIPFKEWHNMYFVLGAQQMKRKQVELTEKMLYERDSMCLLDVREMINLDENKSGGWERSCTIIREIFKYASLSKRDY